MTKSIFITASGTNIGKTYVTCLLARELRAQGARVQVLKPVISGFECPKESDTALLLEAMGQEVTPENIAEISPWRFKAPLSPHDAARREGKEIIFDELIAFCQDEKWQSNDYLLIEGVGGVMVPLSDQHTVRDWISALDCQTLLVTGLYLGTLSHSFSAIESLGKKISAVIISQSEQKRDSDADINSADILATFQNFYPHITTRLLPYNGKAELGSLCL